MTNRGQWIAVGAVFLAIGGVLGAGLALSGDLAPVSIGSRAPAFRVTDLATGDTVALADYSGEVVLLNVWATWCGPCEQEMPSMERLHRELGPEGLKVVAVSIDDSDANGVRRWVADRNLTFQVLWNRSGDIQRTYQTTGVPESFVIDRHGVIVKKVIGATEWDHPTQKALFRRLLADRSTRGAGG
ncbi:MAG TPA: TlpA disulfide reductase family protein [Gemmatimonadales bacterium]|jgi:peroxiredoxin|nr:TlpA disulfide reductase family protein [Gemmatimonadales bacterium]